MAAPENLRQYLKRERKTFPIYFYGQNSKHPLYLYIHSVKVFERGRVGGELFPKKFPPQKKISKKLKKTIAKIQELVYNIDNYVAGQESRRKFDFLFWR